ncbi:MAG: hypothetical protein D6696_10725 [Acidobacteria bacterium]|nr:MAG: hypothetical protein D6696_10725 [Acidobacteriota bacterium]
MARSDKINEELLSGYLDGALPQAEAQRVRILLEDDPELRALYEDLKTLRENAASTRFVEPPEDVWPEWPRTRSSLLTRSLGWLVLIAWFVVISGFALWKFLSQTGDPLEIFLVLGLPGGFVLLFLSVLIDRLRDLRTDRYRGVQR